MTQSNGDIFANGYVWSASQLICGDNDKFSVLGTNGNTEIGGDLKINTDKFVVTAASGNTTVAGLLSITGTGISNSGSMTVQGNTDLQSDVSIGGLLSITGTGISNSGAMTLSLIHI